MKNFLYNNQESIKLSKCLAHCMPELSYSYFQKLLRKQDIRINNKKIKTDVMINQGDEIVVYAIDELLKTSNPDIIYEDENIAVFSKPIGIASEGMGSFEQKVKEIFGGNYTLCHRLDTNTSGLILFAKSSYIFDEIVAAFKNQSIKKVYNAVVYGKLEKASTLTAYLEKNAERARVTIFDTPASGRQKIVTAIKPVKVYDEFSLLEIELITGKTHQIRAHLAYIGFPIIGDSKYGKEEINRKFKKKKQLLIACKIEFQNISGALEYLSGKQISLPKQIDAYFDII